MSRSRGTNLGLALVLAALTVGAYWPALRGGFLWDDDDHIAQCRPLQSAAGLRQIWCEPGATMQYYPLTFSTWWVGYHLWGLTPREPALNPATWSSLWDGTSSTPWPRSPWPYHLLNVLLHVTVALLLWQVLRRLRVPGAYLAGLIFAVHPVHVMSVAWMTELKNVLSGALYLGAVWAYLRFARLGVYAVGPAMPAAIGADDRKMAKGMAGTADPTRMAGTAGPTWAFYILALLLFVLALLAKTATSLLVFALVLLLWWQGRRLSWRELLVLGASVASSDALLRLVEVALRHPALAPRATGTPTLLQALAGTLPGAPALPYSWPAHLRAALVMLAGAAGAWVVVALLRKSTRLRDVLPLAPLVLVSMACGRITLAVERAPGGAEGRSYDLSWLEKALIAGRAFWFYVGKLVFPYKLAFIYPRWRVDPRVGWQYLYPAAFVLLVLGLWLARRRLGRGPLAAVLYAFIGSAALVLLVVLYMTRYSWVADHWQYLSSMGLIALGAAGLARAGQRLGATTAPRLTGYLLAAVLAATLAGLTWRQSHAYQSARGLWDDTLAKYPHCAIAHNNLSILFQKEGKVAAAHEQDLLAVADDPNLAEAWSNLAGDAFAQGDVAEAWRCCDRALELDERLASAHAGRAILLAHAGRLAEAKREYQLAVDCAPDQPQLLYNLGTFLYQTGETTRAIAILERVVELDPRHVQAWNNLGAALAQAGRLDQAIARVRQAVALQPGNANLHANLGMDLAAAGRQDEALAALREAIRLDPTQTPPWLHMGNVLVRQGRPDQAVPCFERAAQLSPRLAPALRGLADAYARAGRFADAVRVGAELLAQARAAGDQAAAQDIQRRLDAYTAGKVE